MITRKNLTLNGKPELEQATVAPQWLLPQESPAPKAAYWVEKVGSLEALASLSQVWDALLENNETRTVELTFAWQITFWKYFNQNAELFVLVVKEANSIVAIAPLKLTHTQRFSLKMRELAFIAAAESNYQDFIIGNNKEEVLDCIFNYLLDHSNQWDLLTLTHLPVTSKTASFFLNQSGRLIYHRITEIEDCISLKIDKPWLEYEAISKKARSKLAYRQRKLQKQGDLTYTHCTDAEQLRSGMLTFFDLHRKRWGQTRTPSQFNDARYCQFYLEVSPQLLTRGQLDLFVLELEKKPVALLYCFLYAQTYLQQLTTYDVDYAQFSPSLVMHELFTKQVFTDGVTEFDFGLYHPYKEWWANCLKQRLTLEIYPNRKWPCYGIFILSKTLHSLRGNLKQISSLRKFVRYIRPKIRGLAKSFFD